MYLDDIAVPQAERSKPSIGKSALIPALVCAGVCVILTRTGFFSIFFLVPLGFCSIAYGPVTAWLGFVFAVLGNGVLSMGFSLYGGMGLADAGPDIGYFTVLSLGFTWIMAGNPPESRRIPVLPPVRTVFRFIAASIAAALVFLGMIFTSSGDGGILALSRPQIEAIVSAYIAASGADAARQAFLERVLTADRIIETLSAVILRGGALFSAFFVFFFSHQAAFMSARLLKRQQGHTGNALIGFHVPRRAIWVLSLCLPVILLCRALSVRSIEIAAWNILVICVILFLAQGIGIVLHNLARRPMPLIMRLLCGLLAAFLVFSPGINALAMGLLALLGIGETWLPLRKSENRERGIENE